MNLLYKNKCKSFVFAVCVLISATTFGQDKLSIAIDHIKQSANEYNLSEDDLSDWVITDQYMSKKSGVEHIYFRQRYNGIEINNANLSIHITDDNEILKINNHFIANLESKINNSIYSINAKQAIESVAKQLNYSIKKPIIPLKIPQGKDKKGLYSSAGISLRSIPLKLVYQQSEDGMLNLAWDMSINEISRENWWHIKVDAITGDIVDKVNWVVHCNHNNNYNNQNNDFHSRKVNDENSNHNMKFSSVEGYRVFEFPIENPSDGGRTLVFLNPNDPIASPFGWHDTNGVIGSEFTTTQGNNIHAFEAGNNSGYSPDGGTNLLFDFPLNLNDNPDQNEDAAITNAFYWGNIIHDICYHYGFDEVSGNFQDNNYGNGGEDDDFVEVRVQDDLFTCNGRFGTPPDGENPTMQMFLCDGRDGAFGNVITIHEYGHGISNRLTGGPSNTSCLDNDEQMGEGWSDYLAMAFTIEANDLETLPRVVADWFFDDPNGIRPAPYSTDMSQNAFTYNDISNLNIPHETGFVWSSMLWEMTWLLISIHGFDDDIYNGTGGNNMAIMLVMEAMKLQPCNPGFVDGRDAILAADVALYNGENQCLIWQAFAKRGLGFSANQGDSDDISDGEEAFDLHDDCVCETNIMHNGTINTGTYRAANTITSTATIGTNQLVTYQAGNHIFLNDVFLADGANNTVFLAEIEACNNSPMNRPVQSMQITKDRIYNLPTGKNKTLGMQKAELLTSFAPKNVPNPFSKQTTIEFVLEEDQKVSLNVFDIKGKQIVKLLNKELKAKGTHRVTFNGSDLPSGMYYYTLQGKTNITTKKMTIVK